MQRPFVLLVALALISPSATAGTVFIPLISAPAALAPSPTWPYPDGAWVSTHTYTNVTPDLLTLRYERVLAGIGASLGCSEGRSPVPPESSWHVSTIAGVGCARPGDQPGFVQLSVDEGLAVSASIHLVAARHCFEPPNLTFVSLAAAPLPVYDAPFPAGSTAHSVGLQPPVPIPFGPACSDDYDPVARRVNLTVANAGHEVATVLVRAPGLTVPPYSFSLAAGQSIQLNGVFTGHDYDALLVTATEPFLVYASSVTTFMDPRRPPALAVYSFRLLR